ncbi:WecB/TagA/CpsF family glycosyltransferase [uncultured Desulfosarcina sp.]|uniref:WecB/TagA/CpsF family glycosyltransferase n=1 Tax=uncultured Desulfosarcina sp. TaxID=218289 RepID=UPI0029C7EF16|nr:WecB/TagA/CpsF family glycosyltransferase [uncultured Desulfosarcina sp.]
MEETKQLIRNRAGEKRSLVMSTINVNWVVEASRNPSFRQAILNSDIVVLDGKPLLWLSKRKGHPIKEVVAGSSLIQELLVDKNTKNPLTIFLFGGEGDIAQQAMDRINSIHGGFRAVGALNPGYGSVEKMCSDEIIDAINQTEPDILLVALGAKKGTQWIEHNRQRLNAGVVSHLGATINFMAGTVQRAPFLMRKLSMEWVWRIFQEPKLFSRYAGDGLILLRLLIGRSY